jgi:putative transposase
VAQGNRVAQGFSPAIWDGRKLAALAAEVHMAIPHRGWTSNSTYFITASVIDKKFLLQSDRMAELFLDVLYHYRREEKNLLHEFVVMPNHFHLLITPGQTIERALQLVKGGFSFRAKKELGFGGEIWQTSFYDHRVRDSAEYQRMKDYIRENPVRAGLVSSPDLCPYSSANSRWRLDEVPQRLKPVRLAGVSPQG